MPDIPRGYILKYKPVYENCEVVLYYGSSMEKLKAFGFSHAQAIAHISPCDQAVSALTALCGSKPLAAEEQQEVWLACDAFKNCAENLKRDHQAAAILSEMASLAAGNKSDALRLLLKKTQEAVDKAQHVHDMKRIAKSVLDDGTYPGSEKYVLYRRGSAAAAGMTPLLNLRFYMHKGSYYLASSKEAWKRWKSNPQEPQPSQSAQAEPKKRKEAEAKPAKVKKQKCSYQPANAQPTNQPLPTAAAAARATLRALQGKRAVNAPSRFKQELENEQ